MVVKKDKFVTKSMLDEAVSAILKGMDNLVDEIKKIVRREVKLIVRKEVEPIKSDVVFIKRDIRDIKVELSDTLTEPVAL